MNTKRIKQTMVVNNATLSVVVNDLLLKNANDDSKLGLTSIIWLNILITINFLLFIFINVLSERLLFVYFS